MKVLSSELTSQQTHRLRMELTGRWRMTSYSKFRLADRGISQRDVLDCGRAGELVEFHNEAGTRRTLYRDGKGVCCVFDLDRRIVVTGYRNNPSDRHETLRREQYHWGQVPDRVLAGAGA